jgi:hypothetical protein
MNPREMRCIDSSFFNFRTFKPKLKLLQCNDFCHLLFNFNDPKLITFLLTSSKIFLTLIFKSIIAKQKLDERFTDCATFVVPAISSQSSNLYKHND